MKKKYKESLKYKILRRIEKTSGSIILRSDLDDLGNYRQISRVLDILIKEVKLVKISYGIYAKAKMSKYTGEATLKTAFDIAVEEALDRLNIKWDLTSAQKAYNEGKTTQIPVRTSVRLKSRCRRKFSFGNTFLRYENNIYAR